MKLRTLNTLYQERKKQIIDEEDPEFPVLIRSLRKALGMKLSAVSEFCGLSRHMLYRMETGKVRTKPQDKRLHKLAELYDISSDYLDAKFFYYVMHYKKKRDANVNNHTRAARP